MGVCPIHFDEYVNAYLHGIQLPCKKNILEKARVLREN